MKEVLEACRREGLKFGVYLSPWDRNHPSYGQGKAYDDCFVNQLIELLTKYGNFSASGWTAPAEKEKTGKSSSMTGSVITIPYAASSLMPVSA